MPYVDIDSELALIANGLTNDATPVNNALTKLKNAITDGSKDANVAALEATTGAFSGAVTMSTTLAVTGKITASGGIDMDGSNIDLDTNKIVTGSSSSYVEAWPVYHLINWNDVGSGWAAPSNAAGATININQTVYLSLPTREKILGATVRIQSVELWWLPFANDEITLFEIYAMASTKLVDYASVPIDTSSGDHETIYFTDDGLVTGTPADIDTSKCGMYVKMTAGASGCRVLGLKVNYDLE